MGSKTSIEWTRGDDGREGCTWNPVRGCSIVSPGCENCYAMRVAARFSNKDEPYEGLARFSPKRRIPQWTGKVRLVEEHLADPIRWTRPRRIFVNSMSDLFHEKLSDDEIAAVFGVMASAPRHTFQILTKRATRMREWFEKFAQGGGASQPIRAALAARRFVDDKRITGCHGDKIAPWPLPNVWVGVSVENQKAAKDRLTELQETPAAVRFISYEPALELVDLREWLPLRDAEGNCTQCGCEWSYRDRKTVAPPATQITRHDCPPGFRARAIHWVIVGGESGPGSRPFDIAWARSVASQCREAGVACFVKQLGAKPQREIVTNAAFGETEMAAIDLEDRKGGDIKEWPADLRVREFPRSHAVEAAP
jgi:protein gp37